MTMNITTKAGTHARIEEMEGMCFSDFHKDVYGYRPRGGEWTSWVEMSAVAFNEALDRMMAKMEADIDAEERAQEAALVEFKSKLKVIMNEYDCDWKLALKLMMIRENTDDVGFFLWEQQISFAKQNEITRKYRGE